MNGRLTYVTLPVADLEAAAAFYETVFAWPAPEARTDARFFRLPELTVALLDRRAFQRFAGLQDAESAPGSAMFSWNVGDRQAVDALLERASAAGAVILKPVERLAWGGWAGVLRTSDGHAWEIVWNPRLETRGQKIICAAPPAV